jgi:hypothetical protein
VSAALAALLALVALVHPAGERGACIRRRAASLAASAQAAVDQVARERPGAAVVPADLLLVVAYLESHLGCAPGSGGCWGAPASPAHRGTAGRPVHAARALASGLRVCTTEIGAVSRFRCGLCRCPVAPGRGYTAQDALRLVERVRREVTP